MLREPKRAYLDPLNRFHGIHYIKQGQIFRRLRERNATTKTSLALDKPRPAQPTENFSQISSRHMRRISHILRGAGHWRLLGKVYDCPESVFNGLCKHP